MRKEVVIFVFLLVFMVSFLSAEVYIPKNCSDLEIKQTWASVFKETPSNITIVTNNTNSTKGCYQYFAYKIKNFSSDKIAFYMTGADSLGKTLDLQSISGTKTNANQELINLLNNVNDISDIYAFDNMSLGSIKQRGKINQSLLNSEYGSIFEETPGNWTYINSSANESIYIFLKSVNTTGKFNMITGSIGEYYDLATYLITILGEEDSPQVTLNAKQQASSKLNETKTNLERIKNQIRTSPQQYQQTISDAITLTTIENKYFALNRSFASANSNEAYNNITLELQKLNVPSQITSSKSARSIVFLPQRENMNIDLLARITGENYSSEKESQYKEAILAWNLDNLDTKIDFTEISMLRNKTQSKIVGFYKINIAEKGEILDDYYLIIPDMAGLKFSGNYNQQPIDDLNYIILAGSEVIEFSSTETISFSELPLFITPKIGALGVSIGGGDGKDKISKWWIFLIIVLFLIIVFFVIYAILHKWYRNEYERYLFTTRTNLFNILHYINNSRGSNMAEGDIAGNLKKSGWSGEQITYAMKTYKGKRTGMMNLFGLFKSNKPGNVAPSPQRVLPPRDRYYTQKNP